jgi:RNA polymerase sigma-70 factor (ECF subfamily)
LVAAYVEHGAYVERVLRRAGVPERDVPDARQDVFVVAHRRLPTFEGRARLGTWLYGIAWNVASEYRRRACNRREQLCVEGCEGSAWLGADDALALRIEHRELLTHALLALDALDEDKREAFVLAEVVGLSMRQVAARVGCPVKTAFSRAYAARRRVLSTLRERGLVFGVLPAWLPLRVHRVHPPMAGGATTHLAAQAQLLVVAVACGVLPGGVGKGIECVPRVRGDGVAARSVSAVVDVASHEPRTATVGGIQVKRRAEPARRTRRPPAARSYRGGSPRGDVAALAGTALDAPGPAHAHAVESDPALVVVYDGGAWLLPAIDHPLDRPPAQRPALPPILFRRGPRSELGQLPSRLPKHELLNEL